MLFKLLCYIASMNRSFEVILAGKNQLSQAAGLFDAYRQFYKEPSDIASASDFLSERMMKKESMVYLAIEREHNKSVGFMQLYPSFSSVSLKSLWILNDLYVVPEFRKQGVGQLLIDAAKTLVKKQGGKGLSLATAHDNFAGRRLYEAAGFALDDQFLHYFWKAP